MAQILLLVTLTLPVTHSPDPFQQCAAKALRGDYGCLQNWQTHAYQLGLRRQVTVRGLAWRTSYYPWEGRQGRIDARGRPCTRRTAAANLLPRGAYIWLAEPCQMRQVLDRGAHHNDHVARRKGAEVWVDTFETRFCENTLTAYAVIAPNQEVDE